MPDNEFSDPAKTLNRVRGLLAKAENEAATKEESELYFAKAAELMAKYGITQALLDANRPDGFTVADRIIDVPGPHADRKAGLLWCVCDALGGKAVILRNRRSQKLVRVHVFGTSTDLERIDIMFTSLLLQLLRFSAVDATHDPYAHLSLRKWHRDYIIGFTSSVTARIRDAEAKAQQGAETSGTSVALVLAKRSDLVHQAFDQMYPKVVTIDLPQTGTGFSFGHAAGNRADIGRTSLDTDTGQALPS